MTAVEKAIKSSLILIQGDEGVLRRRALEEVLRQCEVSPDDLDFETFDAGSSGPVDWIASAGTAPFLASRRVVLVRRLLNCDPEKTGRGILGKIAPTGQVILVADEESGSEERSQRLKTGQRSWEKAVQAAGGAILTYNVDPKAAFALLKEEVSNTGKAMRDSAIQLLLEMCGNSLSRSIEELEKLALYVCDGESISEREVRAVVVPSREWNVFKMTDAAVSNQAAEALRQLRILIGNAARAEEAAYRSILPMFSRTLRLLWQARICVDNGVSASSAPPEVLACFPERPNLANEAPYRHGQMMRVARKTTLPRISTALRILSDTDVRLKGGLPGFTPMDTLERMVLEMAEVLSA